jgi:hypothetical protein
MEAAMTRGLCYWVLMLISLVLGFVLHVGYFGGRFVWGGDLLLFILLLLLGWKVFGPPLHV